MDMTSEAIKKHGAKAVYNAAAAHMDGDKQALASVDLEAANLGVAYSIMMAAHRKMSAADQASDYWEAQRNDD